MSGSVKPERRRECLSRSRSKSSSASPDPNASPTRSADQHICQLQPQTTSYSSHSRSNGSCSEASDLEALIPPAQRQHSRDKDEEAPYQWEPLGFDPKQRQINPPRYNYKLRILIFHNRHDIILRLDSFLFAPGCRWMNQGFSYAFLLVESIAIGYHCKNWYILFEQHLFKQIFAKSILAI